MAGMYEKLGDLLNETLEAGHVKFIQIEREEEPQAESPKPEATSWADASGAGTEADRQTAGSQSSDRKGDGDFARSFYQAETEAERRYFKTSRNDGNHRVSGDSGSSGDRSSYRRVIYRRISPELEKAFSLLGLESTTDKDVVKKAYKEKLLSYHPDRYAGKDVMEKVANDKTREVVAAYRLIMDFLA